MTKPCRDSKGKFVSRGEITEKLRKSLEIFQSERVKYAQEANASSLPKLCTLREWAEENASLYRQFRNRYKIYECFQGEGNEILCNQFLENFMSQGWLLF